MIAQVQQQQQQQQEVNIIPKDYWTFVCFCVLYKTYPCSFLSFPFALLCFDQLVRLTLCAGWLTYLRQVYLPSFFLLFLSLSLSPSLAFHYFISWCFHGFDGKMNSILVCTSIFFSLIPGILSILCFFLRPGAKHLSSNLHLGAKLKAMCIDIYLSIFLTIFSCIFSFSLWRCLFV